jgi:hypothetical protein
MEGEGNPRSVALSYIDPPNTQNPNPVCEPDRVSDEVVCYDTWIYC